MFKMKPLQRSLAALALTAALPLAALAQGKEPVKVGLVTSKSGTFASQGVEVVRAIQFAIDEANAKGGVDGRKVEVQIADDEGTPEAGRRAAEKLASEGYNLLLGPIPTSVSMAIGQNLERWDAAYIAIASKSDKLTGDSCKRRSFRVTPSDAMDVPVIKEWAKSFKEKSFAILAADYLWGHDSGESFKKAVESQGKTVPLSLYAPIGTKDFSPYIAQLKASNVEAIWVAEIGRDAIAFVKQAKEFGLIPAKRLVGHALLQDGFVNATGDALKDAVGTIIYGPDIDTQRNKAFVSAWKAKFNRLPSDHEGMAYNGIEIYFEGIKMAGSVKPGDVSKALRGAQLDTIYGNLTMRAADNQLMLPSYVGRVKTMDGVLRPVIEERFDPALSPPPSPLCKM